MEVPGRWVRVAALLLSLTPAFARAQEVSNKNFDSDLSGWTTGASTGFVVQWAGLGSPQAGAAEILSAAAPAVNSGAYLEQCFNGVGEGDVWRLSARTLTDLRVNDLCRIGVFFFAQPSCSGQSFPSTPTSRSGTNDWTTVVEAEAAPTGAVSAYIYLGQSGAAVMLKGGEELLGDSSLCRFDSVRLAVNGIYAQEFELFPPDWSTITPVRCTGYCDGGKTPSGCYCDDLCLGAGDCCLDACTTCGQCP